MYPFSQLTTPSAVMGANAGEKLPAASSPKRASLSYIPERLRFASLVFGLALAALIDNL